MKLLKLELANFRQYQKSLLEFPSGLLAIIGDNGVGKTTLIEAILFSLFGAKAVRGKTEDLRTRGVQEPLKVSLTFELSGIVYRAERLTTDAFLYVGGESSPLARGTVAVTERLQKLLRLTREEFTATFFTEQKGLEFLSGKKGAAERERFIVRMMGYDRLESLQELLREDRKILKANSVGYENSLGDRQSLVDQQKKEETDLKSAETSLDAQQKVLDGLLSEFEKEKKLFEELDKGYKTWNAASQQLSSTEARYAEKVASLSRIEAQLKELREEGDNAKYFKLTAGERSLDQLIQEQRVIVDQLSARKAKVLSEQNEITSVATLKNQKFESDIQRIKSEAHRYQKDLGEIDALLSGAACPTCGQPVGDSAKKIRLELVGKLESLEELKVNLGSEWEKTKKDSEKKLIQSKEDISSVEKNIVDSQKVLGELEGGLKIEAKRQALDLELGILRDQIKSLDQELHEIRKTRSEIRFSEEKYLAAKTRYGATESMVSVARLQKVELEGNAKTKRALVDRSKEAILAFDEKLQSLSQIRERVAILDEGDEVVTAFRKHLNDSIRPTLSALASDFLSELTDGRYTEVFIGPDFAPSVFDDGEVKNVISGGETDILNLCLRLALSQFLAERAGQPLSLLILDEVFGSLDQQRRMNVLQLLEKLRVRFDQIIIITHMDDTRDAVEHLIEVQFDSSTGTSSIQEANFDATHW